MDFVDNRLNPQTGAMRARAVFDNADRRFTPGLFARIKLVGSGTYAAVFDARELRSGRIRARNSCWLSAGQQGRNSAKSSSGP